MLTISIFWIQAVLSTPVPFLIEAKCFVDPWSQNCPLGPVLATTVESTVSQPIPTPEETPPPENNRVFVQFAGALSREDVTNVSEQLASIGWNVEGASRGGERTAGAAGIDQVRYFHSSDAKMAAQLANDYNRLADWNGFDPLSVAEIQGFGARVPLGKIEIWTSVD